MQLVLVFGLQSRNHLVHIMLCLTHTQLERRTDKYRKQMVMTCFQPIVLALPC